MPQLLLELFCEEIPARMQAQAARDLERMARDKLAEAGFLPEGVKAFAGPRRLTLVADGLAPAQSDREEERKGPRANAPDQAIEGFLRSTGLTRDQLTERDGVLYAISHKKGRPTPEIVAEMVDQIVRGFPWPKSMKWGRGSLRWVRPLQSILCVFDGEVVPFNIDGIQAGDMTKGHRFMGGRQAFRARTFEQYADGLAANFVVLEAEERKARILHEARTLCHARNLELVEDEGLLDEVSGLAEWPTPILGDMDPAFLDLPPEVIRTSMRTHQKYFTVRYPDGLLAPHFLTVANIEASDGGAAIASGNARVLSARLNDARFFWEQDQKLKLEERLEKLRGVTFHAKLGTMYERVQRIEALAREIAPLIGADPELAGRAARLAKADLGTGMVGEFPELQGVMGRYYYRIEAGLGVVKPSGDGELIPPVPGQGQVAANAIQVANAIRDHYRPAGPSDSVPTEPVSVAVALADKLDTLLGFFAIGEKPTGSKDPYALRRAALGIIRIVMESRASFDLFRVCNGATRRIYESVKEREKNEKLRADISSALQDNDIKAIGELLGYVKSEEKPLAQLLSAFAGWKQISKLGENFQISWLCLQVIIFIIDRLDVLLRSEGILADRIEAQKSWLMEQDMPVPANIASFVERIRALDAFLKTENGANLLAGYKRAVNILKAEEKKGPLPVGEAKSMPGAPDEETFLLASLRLALPDLKIELENEQFTEALGTLAQLRAPVDAFFEKVLVNADDAAVRQNRLRLLAQVRDAMGLVADFSLIAG